MQRLLSTFAQRDKNLKKCGSRPVYDDSLSPFFVLRSRVAHYVANALVIGCLAMTAVWTIHSLRTLTFGPQPKVTIADLQKSSAKETRDTLSLWKTPGRWEIAELPCRVSFVTCSVLEVEKHLTEPWRFPIVSRESTPRDFALEQIAQWMASEKTILGEHTLYVYRDKRQRVTLAFRNQKSGSIIVAARIALQASAEEWLLLECGAKGETPSAVSPTGVFVPLPPQSEVLARRFDHRDQVSCEVALISAGMDAVKVSLRSSGWTVQAVCECPLRSVYMGNRGSNWLTVWGVPLREREQLVVITRMDEPPVPAYTRAER